MVMMTEQERIAAWETTMRTVDGLLRRFERDLQDEVRIPLSWYDVLVQLYRAPDYRLRMQALAEVVMLSRSGLTRLIDRMESAGLVLREPSREDRRGYYTILSDKGLSVYQEAREVHLRGIAQHFARHLADDDIQGLLEVWAKVRDGNQAPPLVLAPQRTPERQPEPSV